MMLNHLWVVLLFPFELWVQCCFHFCAYKYKCENICASSVRKIFSLLCASLPSPYSYEFGGGVHSILKLSFLGNVIKKFHYLDNLICMSSLGLLRVRVSRQLGLMEFILVCLQTNHRNLHPINDYV